jgi:hypothetical protein
MAFAYRAETTNKTVTAEIKKEKELEREHQQQAWGDEDSKNPPSERSGPGPSK